mgnify:CR=1 FL=1
MQMENDMADAWDGGVQKLILYSYLFDWPHFFFIIRGRNESVQLFCCELPAGYYRAARERAAREKRVCSKAARQKDHVLADFVKSSWQLYSCFAAGTPRIPGISVQSKSYSPISGWLVTRSRWPTNLWASTQECSGIRVEIESNSVCRLVLSQRRRERRVAPRWAHGLPS